MPDLINPLLSNAATIPDVELPTLIDSTWERPKIDRPDFLKEVSAIMPTGDMTLSDFTKSINDSLTPAQVKAKQDDAKLLASLIPSGPINKQEMPFRYFSSDEAMRYKINDRLWKEKGYNPLVPRDITDAIYDHNEGTWESIKNVFPKLISTTNFAFKNYFNEYFDAAKAIGTLDSKMLFNGKRFEDYAREQKDLEDLNPDYKSDKEVRWWQLGRGDFWEESGSSLGFTIGTIGAAALENLAISAATAGFGETYELYNTPRKVFKAIGDYYSLKRAYNLVKGVTNAKSVLGGLGTAANIYRLVNGGLSEAAFEGATNKQEYLEGFKERFLKEHGYAPSKADMVDAEKAGDEMAKKTILFETPFLLASNAVQFGNMIAPKSIEKVLNFFGKEGAYRLILDPSGKAVVESTGKAGFGKYLDKGISYAKNSLWEGTEESYQALVTKSTADYYNDKYFNKDNNSITKSFGVGFDYITSNEGLKEFAAGFATGSIFDVAAKPFHLLAKPKEIVNDKGEVDYNLRWYNKYFNLGMDKVNDTKEKQKFNNIANELNKVDISKVLKEDGLLSFIKDRETALALGKFTKDKDLFNMHNSQLLQLNRFLYAGLSNGKIDLQIKKLAQFAGQDFKTIADYFGIDENDYPTDDDKQKLKNSISSFVVDLEQKSKEFEKIYEREKTSYNGIFDIVNLQYKTALSLEEGLKDKLRKKYNTTSQEELEKALSQDEMNSLIWARAYRENNEMLFYSVNEAMKASVFSQAGMMEDAKRGKDIVRQIIANDSTNAHYNELSQWFDLGTIDATLKALEEDEKLAEETNSEDLKLKRDLVKTFRMIHEDLVLSHTKGKTYREADVASNIQDYLHLRSQSINGRSFKEGEEVSQFKLLTEYVKLQRQHQENLNLYNFLTQVQNRAGYIQNQSKKLKEFFDKVNKLVNDEKVEEVVPAAPAAPVTPVPAPLPPVTPPPAPAGPAGSKPPTGLTYTTELDIVFKQEMAQEEPSYKVIASLIKNNPQFENETIKYLMAFLVENTADEEKKIDNKTLTEEESNKFDNDLSKLMDLVDGLTGEISSNITDKLNNFIDDIVGKLENYIKPDDAVSDLEMISNPEKYIGKTVSININGEDKTFIIKDVAVDAIKVAETTAPDIDLLISIKDWNKAVQDTKDNIDPLIKEKGRKQVKKGLQELRVETESISKINIIHNIEKNTSVNPNSITPEELDEINQIKEGLVKEGYEIINPINQEWNDGNHMIIEYSVPSSKPEKNGKSVITGVLLPQINKDGVMVQASKVQVTTEVGDEEYEKLTSKKPVYKYSEEVRQRALDQNVSLDELDNITAGRKKSDLTLDELNKYIKSRDEEKLKKEKELRKRIIKSLSSDPIIPLSTEELEYYNLHKDEIDKEIKPTKKLPVIDVDEEDDKSDNELDILVDDAKESGIFFFIQNLPNEISKIWEKGKRIILKGAEGDQKEQALRLRNTLKVMSSKSTPKNFFSEEEEEIDGQIKKVKSFKIKLVRGDEKIHSDWLFWNMKGLSNSKGQKYEFPLIIAVIVDKDGEVVNFDTKGNIVGEKEGKPVAFTYSVEEYLSSNLNKSRKAVFTRSNDNLTEFEEAGYEKLEDRPTDPLADIRKLLSIKDIYGSIELVTNGTLSRTNSINSSNRSKRSNEEFRTLSQMIEEGDIEEGTLPLLAVSRGNYFEDTNAGQRVKKGQPYVYDNESGLYISLQGNKIKDLKVNGEPVITEYLKAILEELYKNGKVTIDDLDITDPEFINLYNFIRDLFYSEDVHIGTDGNNELKRPFTTIFYESKTPTSVHILERRVNFNDVNLENAQMGIPFTDREFSYGKFIRDNFYSSAVKVETGEGNPKFEKLNRRIGFVLRNSNGDELTHKDILGMLNDKTVEKKSIIITPSSMKDKIVGKVFMSKKGNPVEIISYDKRKNTYIVRNNGKDTEVSSASVMKDLDMSKEISKINPSEEVVNEFNENDIAASIPKEVKDEILLSDDNNTDDINFEC